jgi:hypothetical protein
MTEFTLAQSILKTPRPSTYADKVEAKKTGALREFCDVFTTLDFKSTYRICAALLSSFMGRGFDGNRPLMTVVGPYVTVGKTSTVNACSRVTSGEPPVLLKTNEANDKAFGSTKGISNPVTLFDNITYMKGEIAEEIARTLTGRTYQVWIMFVTHGFYPNHWTWWATFNSEYALTSDLLARALVIEMKAPTEEEKTVVGRKIEKIISEKRQEILRDIAWVFAQEQQITEFPHKPHPKYISWSDRMAKLLHIVYPEVAEFDFSISEEEKERFDADYGIFNEALERITTEEEQSIFDPEFPKTTPEDWYSDDYVLQVFRELVKGAKWTENTLSLTKKIKPMAKRLAGWEIEQKRINTPSVNNSKRKKIPGWIIRRMGVQG